MSLLATLRFSSDPRFPSGWSDLPVRRSFGFVRQRWEVHRPLRLGAAQLWNAMHWPISVVTCTISVTFKNYLMIFYCCHLTFSFRDTTSNFDASSKRYVVTNPPDDFSLMSTDQVRWGNKMKILGLNYLNTNLCFPFPPKLYIFVVLISRSMFCSLSSESTVDSVSVKSRCKKKHSKSMVCRGWLSSHVVVTKVGFIYPTTVCDINIRSY